jgi:hypothetical protein
MSPISLVCDTSSQPHLLIFVLRIYAAKRMGEGPIEHAYGEGPNERAGGPNTHYCGNARTGKHILTDKREAHPGA